MNFLAKLPFAFSRGTSNVTIRCTVSEHRNTGLKILWMNLILRTFTGINLNEKDKMEDSCENIRKHHPQYFNFLRFIKLIIIYYMWIKIDQAFNSNISKASSSYSYNLFEQLISTLSN